MGNTKHAIKNTSLHPRVANWIYNQHAKGDIRNIIVNEICESIRVKQSLLNERMVSVIYSAAKIIISACRKKRKIVWLGNGGSAADAQHLACELVSTFEHRDPIKRKAIRSIALNTNTSIMTAVGNDFSFEYIFERQVEAHIDRGDVVIGLSTSGNSVNVINALRLASKMGATTIGFTGKSGGRLRRYADILIAVPHERTRLVQEAHMTIGHIICLLVERELFEQSK